MGKKLKTEILNEMYANLKEISKRLITLENIHKGLEKVTIAYDASDSKNQYRKKLLIDTFKKLIECKIEENTKNKLFCSYFRDIYKIKCQVHNGVISCGNPLSLKNKYDDILSLLWALIGTGNMHYKKYLELKKNYNQLSILVTILKDNLEFALFQKEFNFLNLENEITNLESVIIVLEKIVSEFSEALECLTLYLPKENYANYILNNTFLLPLIFANNDNNAASITKKCDFLPYSKKDKKSQIKITLTQSYFNSLLLFEQENQVKYLMNYEGISYNEAILLLAEIFLIEIPNNPYKGQSIVNKYRNSLLSDELLNFIVNSYDSIKENDEMTNLIYNQMISTIERVRAGIRDNNLEMNEPFKKMNLGRVQTLNNGVKNETIN